jgi:hypothetical protein
MNIAYTGSADFQEFSKNDFEKAGIEDAKAMRFAKGQPAEVPDEVGEALTSKEGIFGDHSFVNLDNVEEGDTEEETLEHQREAAEKAAAKVAKKAAKSPQTGADAKVQSASSGNTEATSTGKGTSTGSTTPGSTR